MNLKNKLYEGALRDSIEYFLSCYPEDQDNEEILKMVGEQHEDITVWEPFEFYGSESVIEGIQEMAHVLSIKYEDILNMYSEEYLNNDRKIV
jgi:hypothetical protein